MILAIDIGNTNVKLGVFSEDGKLLDSTRLSSSTHKTGDEYYLAIRDSFGARGINLADIDGVIISSVNPNLNYTFEHLISVYFRVKPMVVGGGIKTGINIRYDNPKEVGADRIVNSVAAYRTRQAGQGYRQIDYREYAVGAYLRLRRHGRVYSK